MVPSASFVRVGFSSPLVVCLVNFPFSPEIFYSANPQELKGQNFLPVHLSAKYMVNYY